ncbi:hypothetical protein MAR_000809 [Mya arenaria]|uniref:Uncharacterized protein n=1 Tax=Mya arenaria TaxID=6604 RepID=A0ABY7FI95_MYAAR|nr:hypothetical protein MAR_000809 [Mya arenaria]
MSRKSYYRIDSLQTLYFALSPKTVGIASSIKIVLYVRPRQQLVLVVIANSKCSELQAVLLQKRFSRDLAIRPWNTQSDPVI